MSLIDARRRNARPRRLRFSQSLARRLHRPSHANVEALRVIGSLDDFDIYLRHYFCHSAAKQAALIATIGVEPPQAPQIEISMDGRTRRQVFRNGPPLATCRQNIHEAVHHLAHDHRAFVAAALGGRDQRLNKRPFVISQIAGIAQEATIITSAVVRRPHGRLLRIRPPPLNHK